MRQAIKQLSTFSITILCTFFAFGATCYVSCKKDKCKDIQCLNGGSCAEGNCSCPAGTWGSRCDTGAATKFIRTWHYTFFADQQTYEGPITIGAGTEPDKAVYHIYMGSEPCFTEVILQGTVTANELNFPTQAFVDKCGKHFTYDGSAVITGDSLKFCLNYHDSVDAASECHTCY